MRGKVITAYGAKTNGKANDGINLAVPEGTPIKAADDGVVAYSGNELKGYGNLVLIRHPNGYVTAYAHASELLVKRGDTIKRGQVIAKSGQSGEVAVAATALRDPQGLLAGRPAAIPQRRVSHVVIARLDRAAPYPRAPVIHEGCGVLGPPPLSCFAGR